MAAICTGAALVLIVLLMTIISLSPTLAASHDDNITLQTVGGYAHTEQARIDLVVPTATLSEPMLTSADEQADDLWLGLRFQMQPGWKIYWKQPGAGGRPPSIDWSDSTNVEQISIAWPKPERFTTYGLLSYGYADQVVLPVRLRRIDARLPVHLRFDVTFFICREICIPDQVELQAVWPVAGSSSVAVAEQVLQNVGIVINPELIKQSLAKVPVPYAGEMHISPPSAQKGQGNRWRLSWSVESAFAHGRIDALFDGNGLDDRLMNLADEVYFSEPLITFDRSRHRFTVSTEAENLDIQQPVRLYLDFIENGQAHFAYADFDLNDDHSMDWLSVLYFAVLGGMILNVMPCVFPVLMLKLFGISRHMAADHRQGSTLRRGLLSTAMGVVTGFVLMGLVFVVIRQAGGTLHWGMQFQQPVFLSVMVFVLVLFATQLWGCWTWHLPLGLSRTLIGVEDSLRRSQSVFSDFCAGVVATILATPCSAPLIGVAIGVALFADNVGLLVIFASMGLGMAVPYLLMACLPVRWWYLPKPGVWMQYAQSLMGVGVMVTALWVVWLLAQAIGVAGAASLMFVVALLVAVMFSHRIPHTKIAMYRGRLAVLLVILGLAVSDRFTPLPHAAELPAGWQTFAPQQIERHVQAGRVVLVDITASWCVTCVVNDHRVYNQPQVLAWRQQPQVIAMRGDWSLPDLAIERFLWRYQRRALPFAVVYSAKAPEGIILDDILSVSGLHDSLQRAGVNVDLGQSPS